MQYISMYMTYIKPWSSLHTLESHLHLLVEVLVNDTCILDAGFCIIGLHRLDSTLAAGDGDHIESIGQAIFPVHGPPTS
jgi:hypothetical protein